DAQEAYARWLHGLAKDTVWATGGCSSWYLDAGGEPSAVWPSSARHYQSITRRFDIEAYRALRAADVSLHPVEAMEIIRASCVLRPWLMNTTISSSAATRTSTPPPASSTRSRSSSLTSS